MRVLCGSRGVLEDDAEKIWGPSSDIGGIDRIFQALCGRALPLRRAGGAADRAVCGLGCVAHTGTAGSIQKLKMLCKRSGAMIASKYS